VAAIATRYSAETMKMHFIKLACISINLMPAIVLAQSTFRFENFNAYAGIDAPVFDAAGNRLAGTDYAAELWGGAASDSLSPTLEFFSGQRNIQPFATGLAAGYFTSTKSMAVWQVFGGQSAWLQVRAWDTRLGSTYEAVQVLGLGGFGESQPFYAQGGNPLADPPDIPKPLVGLQSFSLREVVPEPSTWALLTLGGATLCWLSRWRKRGP